MAWIELHQSLMAHPKTKRLARRLGVNMPTAIGTMACLWCWCVEYAQDGNLAKFTTEDIADAAEWTGDPEALIAAMVEVAFVDSDADGLRIHNWHKYAGRLMEQRRHHAANKKRARDLYENADLTKFVRERDGDCCRYCGQACNFRDRKSGLGGTYDHVDPAGPNTVANIVVACRACNAGKGRRTPDEARMPLIAPTEISARNLTGQVDKSAITVPNRTVPNQEIMSTDVDVPMLDVPFEADPSPLLTPAEDDLDLEAVFPEAAAEGVTQEVSRAAPKPTDMADPDFDAWWALYPRKVAKDEARKAWRRITKKDAPEALTAGLRRWLASADWAGTERQYLPHPATWLNGGRWKDEPEPAGIVPIATAASSPREAFLTWVRGLTSTIGRNDDKVRCLVERATVVDGVTVDLDAAHRVLEEQGLDEAWVWVHRATQMGKAQRREVANG